MGGAVTTLSFGLVPEGSWGPGVQPAGASVLAPRDTQAVGQCVKCVSLFVSHLLSEPLSRTGKRLPSLWVTCVLRRPLCWVCTWGCRGWCWGGHHCHCFLATKPLVLTGGERGVTGAGCRKGHTPRTWGEGARGPVRGVAVRAFVRGKGLRSCFCTRSAVARSAFKYSCRKSTQLDRLIAGLLACEALNFTENRCRLRCYPTPDPRSSLLSQREKWTGL